MIALLRLPALSSQRAPGVFLLHDRGSKRPGYQRVRTLFQQLLVAAIASLACGYAFGLTVSGELSADTHWRQADSPVLIASTVSVNDGAQLRIDPGVVVAFADGASLEVVSGSLHAQGLAPEPVSFISQRELEGAQPSSGEWGSVILGPGTRSSATLLEHVNIRHGHGIRVYGSAPQLNFLRLEENAGAAIDLDLEASPHGEGLLAIGNDIDGIRVPKGQIVGNVVWALRGIPYVLEQGVIHVGRSAFALIPQSLEVATGVVAELELAIPAPADVGGQLIDLASSVPGVVSVPGSAQVAAGETPVAFVLEALAEGVSTVSASHADLGLATASVKVVNLTVSP